ncbi:MAG: hypothetical protein GTO45_08860 [Candidatus Aminicenantes bacterium]|nr:hypothetical protein [Candidatus Aminicenantes bacterium]NIM78942.1 hypothetical protein [Candidatus Aminicenantes bacterium]NIN18202.1 hypothetical protein [Candidatus Aminicenantes bacterium]NIN42101.1 hypothetical protein [Candidatus Aminicenantes bacterium]NIN84854.1 hypothetical protein [Candidatus Aminicenantes bacterium]
MRQIRLSFLKVCLGTLVVLAFNVQAVAKIVMNYSDSSFEEQSRGQMETYVVEAAGYFLKSHSDMFLFLNKVEMSDLEGTDFAGLQSIIDCAVVNMQNAQAKYSELTALADSTPYDQTVLQQLAVFDYAAFRDSKGLNSVIYSDVKAYLQSGDVRGVYYKLYWDTQQILDLLILLKSAVDADTLPDMPDVWRANRIYSDTFLFGQYTAEIFYEITGK